MRFWEILMENAKKEMLLETFGPKAWAKYQALGWDLGWDSPKAVIDGLCALDPTAARRGDKLLEYSKWIINLFNKKAGNTEGDLLREDLDSVRPTLEAFDRIKMLPTVEKDINRYKSLQSLYVVIDQHEDQEVKSKREEKREKKDAIWAEIEKVYESENIAVYIPKTFDASCFLGNGARWCTTASHGQGGESQFKSYSAAGPLYIIFIKNEFVLARERNPKTFMFDGPVLRNKDGSERKIQVKYQFSLARGQFMDSTDSGVDLKKMVIKYPDLKKCFSKIITMQDLVNSKDRGTGNCMALSKWNSVNDFTPAEKIAYAVLVDPKSLLNYINQPDFTPEMLMELCQTNGKFLEYLIKDKRLTSDMIKVALTKNPDAISFVGNDKRLTADCILAAVKSDIRIITKVGLNPNLPDDALRWTMTRDSKWVPTIINKRLKAKLRVPDDVLAYAKTKEWIDL